MLFSKTNVAKQRLRFFQIVQRYVNAGIAPVDSIQRFKEGLEPDDPANDMARTILRDMQNGRTFSESIKKFPNFFPPFVVGLIEVGQESGQLPRILNEIVYHLEQSIDIKRKVDAATLIPKISVVGIILVFLFATMYIIPKLGDLLVDSGLQLPFITSVVYNFSLFLQGWWFLVLGGIAAIVFGIYSFKKSNPERYDILTMHLPIYAPLARYRLQYDFTKTFGLCITAGIRAGTALKYTALAIDNLYVKNFLDRATAKILNAGTEVDVALKHEDVEGFLSKDTLLMIRTGTDAGNLGDIMMYESKNYKKDLDQAANSIGDKVSMTVLIPAYLAILVLFAAIYYPILTMMQMNPQG